MGKASRPGVVAGDGGPLSSRYSCRATAHATPADLAPALALDGPPLGLGLDRLVVLLVLPALALVVALADAGPLGPGTLAVLLLALRAPGLAPVLAALVLTGAGALAAR